MRNATIVVDFQRNEKVSRLKYVFIYYSLMPFFYVGKYLAFLKLVYGIRHDATPKNKIVSFVFCTDCNYLLSFEWVFFYSFNNFWVDSIVFKYEKCLVDLAFFGKS